MPRKTDSPATSDMGSQELTEEIIRMRAYYLFEQRGGRYGNDLDDWLQAEAEVMAKKPAPLPITRNAFGMPARLTQLDRRG